MFVVGSVIYCLTWSPLFENNYRLCLLLVIGFTMAFKIAAESFSRNDGTMTTALTPPLTFVVFNFSTFYILILNSVHLVSFCIRWSYEIAVHSSLPITEIVTMVIANIVIQIGICLLCACLAFDLEKSERISFVLLRRLDARMARNK